MSSEPNWPEEEKNSTPVGGSLPHEEGEYLTPVHSSHPAPSKWGEIKI